MKLLLKKWKLFSDHTGSLAPFYRKKSFNNFNIKRFFFVYGNKKYFRANHAHKECSQLIFCVSGELVVVCDDSFKKSTLILNNPSDGILVPPGIWLEQTYKKNNSILNVICDLSYDPDDYISDYKEFEAFKL